MTFADVLGYSFRKRLALTIERQAVRHQVYEQVARDDEVNRSLQQPWAGGGALDDLRQQCPFPFVVWLVEEGGRRTKIRSAMDVSRLGPAEPIGVPHGMRADTWWRGFNLDVWLKSTMFTFNRIFPHEINRFAPRLCEVEDLSRHMRFASVFGMGDEFSEAYISGLSLHEQSEGANKLALAKGRN